MFWVDFTANAWWLLQPSMCFCRPCSYRKREEWYPQPYWRGWQNDRADPNAVAAHNADVGDQVERQLRHEITFAQSDTTGGWASVGDGMWVPWPTDMVEKRMRVEYIRQQRERTRWAIAYASDCDRVLPCCASLSVGTHWAVVLLVTLVPAFVLMTVQSAKMAEHEAKVAASDDPYNDDLPFGLFLGNLFTAVLMLMAIGAFRTWWSVCIQLGPDDRVGRDGRPVSKCCYWTAMCYCSYPTWLATDPKCAAVYHSRFGIFAPRLAEVAGDDKGAGDPSALAAPHRDDEEAAGDVSQRNPLGVALLVATTGEPAAEGGPGAGIGKAATGSAAHYGTNQAYIGPAV